MDILSLYMYWALADDVKVIILGGNSTIATFSKPNNEW